MIEAYALDPPDERLRLVIGVAARAVETVREDGIRV